MNKLNQKTAEEYARWFRCLGDATRIRILNLVASAAEPLTVGEIVKKIGKSQSTISHHLQIMAEERFVLMQLDGVRTIVSVNTKCMSDFPIAAAQILAQPITLSKRKT